ncbi:EscU/YscU/HrcU family type III secretion system export apparatus switch protein [Treponema sp.]|uniref:EscU/YscU/HrcU family type III secretion system export apparatus switch protein n=1 Tax=Treponema sp. TaxID=166 RepID=UPI00298E7A45|nr:EscU/YscU/HrcU family type III secretion system export apparatus switch protein [Treponema sp.]
MMHEKKAVALKYPEGAEAPFITVTAKGELAQKVLDIAKDNDIAVVQNNELTEFLSVQEIGTCVPENVWPVLAKIFAFVMQNS